MKVLGKIEVFKNKRGYLTGKILSFTDKKVVGTSYIDVKLAEGIKAPEEGTTITYEVVEGYLNSIHVESERESFEKLVISIVKAVAIKTFSAKDRD